MTPWRRRLRRARRVVVYGFAGLVILAGVAVALASQLLPLVQRHPDEVAAWLSERIGQPVRFDVGAAEWTQRGPLITLNDLRIGRGEQALDIGRAELLVHAYAGMLPGRALTELRLRGLEVTVQRDADGRWHVAGLAGREGGDALRQLEAFGELRLDAARITLVDVASGRTWQLDRVDARLLSAGPGVRVGGAIRRDRGQPLRFAAVLDADDGGGRVWLGGEALALADWTGGIDYRGIVAGDGAVDVGLWLDLAQRRVVDAQVELSADGLQLARAGDEEGVTIERLRLAARWSRTDAGWRLSLPLLDIGVEGRDAQWRDVVLHRENGWRASAQHLEIAPLARLASLVDDVPDALRDWLAAADARAVVQQAVAECGDRGCRADAQLLDLAVGPVGKAPGITGLAGQVRVDGDTATLALRNATLRVASPGRFREPVAARASGDIVITRADGDVHIALPALDLAFAEFAARAHGRVVLQRGGGRPRLDLHARTGAAPVSAAQRFWIVDRMPPKVVQWLDDALVDGRLVQGRVSIAGDLDDWPFRGGEGRFEAIAQVEDVRLDYLPGKWPAADVTQATARFVNDGLQFEATGSVLGNTVSRAIGGIERFREPVLTLDVAGSGSGESLLALLRESPVQAAHGEHLDGVSATGTADVEVKIVAPLKKQLGRPTAQGHADVVDADIVDTRRELAFDDASGRVRFGHNGFSADALDVRYEDQPATFSLAVGGYTGDDAHVVEATLAGDLAIDTLLQRQEATRWLLPYARGTSRWRIDLAVDREQGDRAGAQRLTAASDLTGTVLSLPQPLRKPAADTLPLRLEVGLPLERGTIALQMGELLSLRGTMSPDFRGVVAFGGARAEIPPRLGGFVVVGRVPVLDAAEWTAFAAGLAGGAGRGTEVERIDVLADALALGSRTFAQTRVVMSAEDDARRIRFEGEPLQGEIVVPTRELDTRGIDARFTRLHWPPAPEDAPPAPLLSGVDPRDIPPISLSAQSLRFGRADLGATTMQTYPTPEGMHIERFESQAPDLSLRASGDWTLIDGRERSSFGIDFGSDDLGGMLAALGFSGIVEEGPTQAQLSATWPGSPAAFELRRLDGSLSLSIGQGRIPDVQPGVGRILGLFSLSEIPRRLSLDFSDLFREGFAFNTITGDFQLDGGGAYTDNLVIDGPAAEIRIRGRTGLDRREYEQTMEVLPRASGVLPVVGALAAGPAGAAIGAVAQAVFQTPMKQMTRTLYRVQGSWDEPVIEVIDRGPAPSQPREPARNGP